MYHLYRDGYLPTFHFRWWRWPGGNMKLQQQWRSDRLGFDPVWMDVPVYTPTHEELKDANWR